MNIRKSYTDRIAMHNMAIAGFSAQIKYQEGLGDPDRDLIHDLKALYETEKMHLEEAWKKVKAKGEKFLAEVFQIIKELFEELVSDLIKFLKRHNLNEILEFLKGLF